MTVQLPGRFVGLSYLPLGALCDACVAPYVVVPLRCLCGALRCGAFVAPYAVIPYAVVPQKCRT